MNNAVWTYGWFLLYVAITRMVTVGLLTAVILERARRAAEPEKVATEVTKTSLALNSIITVMAGPPEETGERVVTREEFMENFFKCTACVKLAKRLSLMQEDLPDIWDCSDRDNTNKLGPPEIVHMYFNLKKLSKDVPLTVALRRARNHTEKRNTLMSHWN